jgi:hypothetical protein
MDRRLAEERVILFSGMLENLFLDTESTEGTCNDGKDSVLSVYERLTQAFS